ncbi:ROK family protein [Stomatohabitans albus]|uniref:ROK family protein n=1 Tax=Stomatohabitans albus TaxID=3110766 RepID=UPI00300D835E
MSSETPYAIGIDLGGTKLACGLIDRSGRVEYAVKKPTRGDQVSVLSDIASAIKEVWTHTNQTAPTPVGIGVPGLVTHDGIFRYGPNISLRDVNIAQEIRQRTGATDVHVENDANVALWAEYCLGAGRTHDAHEITMVNLGTGIGGAFIVNGKLVRGARGFAGEPGHMVIAVDGVAGVGGLRGEIEAYASGWAMGRLARERRERFGLLDSVLQDADPLDGKAVTMAASDGDAGAIAIVNEAARWLGIHLAGLVNALDPELIILGGGAASAHELMIPEAQRVMNTYTLGYPLYREPVPIVHAEMDNNAGMIGAGLLGLGHHAGRLPA